MYLPFAYIVAGLTAFFSLLILIRLYFKRYRNNRQFVFHFAGSLLCAVFVFLFGGWFYISIYLKWGFAALYVSVFILTVVKRSTAGKGKKGIGPWYYVIFRLVLMGGAAFLIAMYFNGKVYDGHRAIDLKFPFRSGSYFVMQGGANRFVNMAHRNYSIEKYGFAMDISKLYPSGNRAKGIMPREVSDYAIYGDTVLSPCTGKVIVAADTIHTNIPGHYNKAYVHGNHIIIQCDKYRVFMAHFIKGQIFVHEGDAVKAGQPLGLAGNSGFSAEPHLHINVIRDYATSAAQYKAEKYLWRSFRKGPYDDYRYTGTSVPFTFGGVFYVINDVMDAGAMR